MEIARAGRILAATASAGCLVLGITAPIASATVDTRDRRCTGVLGAETVNRDLRVPPGETCTLNGTRVRGDVRVQENANLIANDATIEENLEGTRPGQVDVGSSRIDGDAKLNRGESVELTGTTVGNRVEVTQYSGPVQIADNTVGEDVRANRNRGGVTITGNRIGEDLECNRNNPPPTGGDNVVQGDRKGQCRQL